MNVVCNKCGKTLQNNNDILLEDCLDITKTWGYFSEKDGEIHRLTICEDCYNEWISSMVVPVDIRDATELI